MLQKIKETAVWLSERMPAIPQAAIVLGSGLGGFAREVEETAEFAYSEIPNFPVSTVAGHAGKLTIGTLRSGLPEASEEELAKLTPEQLALYKEQFCKPLVAVFQGRFHYYEGYTMQQATFHVRVLQELGVQLLVLTNAAGGVNPEYCVGDIMLIRDHINFMPEHPLHGPNLPYGERFPNMTEVYDASLRADCKKIAAAQGFSLREGVYLATQGPTYETPAEYRMYRLLGADAVGMSTVPEAIVARHGGMRVLGLSVITNAVGGAGETNHEEVQQAAAGSSARLIGLLKVLLG